MEYLLAQSNRGDLSQQTDLGDVRPELSDEDQEDDCPDVTLPQAHDISMEVILKVNSLIIHQNKIWEN